MASILPSIWSCVILLAMNVYYFHIAIVGLWLIVIVPQLTLPDDIPSTRRHSMTAVSLAPGLIEVTMFGGDIRYHRLLSQPLSEMQSILATAIIMFSELSDPVYREGVICA